MCMKWLWDNFVELLRFGAPLYFGWIFIMYGFDDPSERVMVGFLLMFLWIMWYRLGNSEK